jgi:hypothetical protein
MTQGNGKMKEEEETQERLLLRLIKVLGMTTSDNDNIALVAARRANDILEKLDTDWSKLIKGKVTIIADPFTNIVPSSPASPVDRPPPTPSQQPRRPAAAPLRCAQCGTPMAATIASTRGYDFCSRACLDTMFPPKPKWRPAPPPRYTDRIAIKGCLDALVGKYIRSPQTKNRIQFCADEFNREGSLTQDDWIFLAATAARIGNVKVTTDML